MGTGVRNSNENDNGNGIRLNKIMVRVWRTSGAAVAQVVIYFAHGKSRYCAALFHRNLFGRASRKEIT